jgi:hypothetical protein
MERVPGRKCRARAVLAAVSRSELSGKKGRFEGEEDVDGALQELIAQGD